MVKKLHLLFLLFVLVFLLALPFQVWDSIVFPAQNGKILFGGWFSILLILLWVFQVTFSKNTSRYTVAPIDVGLIIYVFFLLIHTFFIQAVNTDPLYIIRMVSLIPVYLLIRITSHNKHRYLFLALLATALGQAVWGLLQHRGVLPSMHLPFSATGTFFNPGPYAGYMAAVTPFAIAILIPEYAKSISIQFKSNNPVLWRLIGFICIAIIIMVLVIAQSRSAWLAVIASSGYLLLHLYRKKLQIKHFLLIIIIGITVITLLYRLNKDSANGRLFIWSNTIEMIKDHPVTGVGVNAFQAHYMHYQAEWFMEHPDSEKSLLADNNIFAFNEPLRIVSDQGVPGLIISILLLAIIFFRKTGSNKNQLLPTVAKSGIIGVLVFGLFSYPFSVFPLQVVFVVNMAVIASTQNPVVVRTMSKQKQFSIKTTIVCFAIVATLLFSHKLYNITIACHKWKIAFKHFKPNRAEKSLNLCRQIYPQLKNNGAFNSMYGAFLTHAGQYDNAIPVLTRATEIEPNTNIYLNLGDCYMNKDSLVEAEKAYKYALQMIPSRIKPVYKLALLYMFSNRNSKAMEIIEGYLNREKKKRTIASYEIELELIEIKNELIELCN